MRLKSALQRSWRHVVIVVAGLLFLAVAGWLVISASVYRVPSYGENQIQHPEVAFFATKDGDEFVVRADFRDEHVLKFMVFPTTLDRIEQGDSSFSADGRPPLWVNIQSFQDFGWKVKRGFTQFATSAPDQELVPTEDREGAGSSLVLKGQFTAQQPVLEFELTDHANRTVSSGPYRRILFPTIEGSGHTETPGATIDELPQIGGMPVYPPRLGVWAVAMPYVDFDPDLSEVKVNPPVTYEPPMTWQIERRFFANIVLRDARWDRTAAVKTFLGGLLVGIGTTLVLAPLAFTTKPDPTPMVPVNARKQQPRKRRRPRR